MNLHLQYQTAILNEMRQFLENNFVTLGASPNYLADEVKTIADHVKKSADATHLRNYLLDYIGLTSNFWRTLAPYTYHNKLLSHLEAIVNSPDFSPQSIQLGQITHLHEYYLTRQKQLIEPLQIEIQSLRTASEKLQNTVSALREENLRLRTENEFFIKELVTLQTKLAEPTAKSLTSTLTVENTPTVTTTDLELAF